MTKTLKELGEEYLEEIELLDEKIERYRTRLKKHSTKQTAMKFLPFRDFCVFFTDKSAK